jgi:hypothetical protein
MMWGSLQNTHKKPTRVASVEIDDEWKAGHAVDPFSEIQFPAILATATAAQQR